MSDQRASILVVDDQPDNLRTLSAILRTEGYKVRQAVSGEMALETVRSQCPDIILLDIKMPLMDGYTVCSTLKASAATCEIAVIFLSALDETADKVKAFALGGVDYITKPFQAEEVIARVENQLRISRLSKQLAEQNARLTEEIQVRQIAEAALKESEARLKLALEATQTICWERDLTTDRILFSSTLADSSTALEISYLEALALIHPDDQEQVHQANQDAIANRASFEIEYRVLVEEQPLKWKWVLAKGKVLVDETGKPTRLIGVSVDISDRKLAEEQLRLLERAIAVSNNGIIVSDALAPERPIIYVNSGFERITGYRREEVIGKNCRFLQGTDTNQPALETLKRAIASGRETQVVLRNYRKDGTLFWNELCLTPVRDETGDLTHFIGVQTDITQRKLVEEALRLSEERLQLALAGSEIAIWDWNISTRQIYFSPQCNTMLGYEVGEIEDSFQAWERLVYPEDLPRVKEAINANLEGRSTSYEVEFRMLSKSGEWQWILCRAKVMERDESGLPVRMTGARSDISDRKKAQETLLIAQKRLEYLLSSSPSVIFTANVTEPYSATFISENFFELFGYESRESLKNENFWVTRLHSEDKARILAEIPQLIKRGHHTFEYRFLHKDSTYHWIYEPCKLIRDEEGNPLEIIGSMSDITTRKQVEAALQESQHWLQAITEANPNILYLYDLIEQQIVYVNREVYTILGYTPEEIIQMQTAVACNLLHPGDKAAISERLLRSKKAEEGDIFEYEYRMRHKQGEWRWLFSRETVFTTTADGKPKQILGTATDISDRKLAEARERAKTQQLEQTLEQLKHTQAQLIQTEKMSSLGRMVAGVAHEINNPVSFIYANINPAMEYAQELLKLMQLYAKHYPDPVTEISEQLEVVEPDFIAEDFPKLLTSMKDGAERITQIVLSLRNFSRLDQSQCKQVNIHEGINSTLNILQHRLKPKCDCSEIQVIKEYGQLPLVDCYPGQLNQVFMNIISNAIDALRDAHDSSFIVPLRESELHGLSESSSHDRATMNNQQSCNKQDAANVATIAPSTMNHEQLPTIRIHTEVVERNRVAIRITDNGSGINPEILPQIFDPFFTTKPVGNGTGIGLSISYQVVVNQHGGQLTCHSTPEQGTEFVIELPIAQGKTSVKI